MRDHFRTEPVLPALLLALTLSACDDPKIDAKPERAPSAAPSAAPKADESPPGPCKASGATSVELGSTPGHVYGFSTDAHHVYYTSWQTLSNRGDVGKARKDGGGRINLGSLTLEPRGLVVDARQVLYTAGIRLMSVSKAGGDAKVHAETFSSQSIASDGTYVYGVPGDYGPYDRLIRVPKAGGSTYELDVSERPESKDKPEGFSAIAVDSQGIYVTDSSAGRVLRFPLERGKPKSLATKQAKPYDLALDDTNVYFTLALSGQLMKVPKAGGAASKLGFGLTKYARIAADAQGIFTVLAGKTDADPQTIIKLPLDGGDPAPVAPIAAGGAVEAIAVDAACVYWAQYSSDTQNTTILAKAR